jgi:hypothetical protein
MSFGKPAEADEGTGNAGEGGEVAGSAFVTAVRSYGGAFGRLGVVIPRKESQLSCPGEF